MDVLRVAIGFAGLFAWVLIILAGVERECVEHSRLTGVCLEYGDLVFNYFEAGMLSAVLMAGVISAYLAVSGGTSVFRSGLD